MWLLGGGADEPPLELTSLTSYATVGLQWGNLLCILDSERDEQAFVGSAAGAAASQDVLPNTQAPYNMQYAPKLQHDCCFPTFAA
jgi:hypothetical protein